jgi:hypothetical protein
VEWGVGLHGSIMLAGVNGEQRGDTLNPAPL